MIDPKTLSVEERAIVEETVTANVSFDGLACDLFWDKCYEFAIQRILARRALFGEPASEGAKVECPNCGQPGEHYHSGDMPHVPAFYTCQPAQREYDAKPQDFGSLLDAQHRHIQEIRASREPAAPVGEMPEAVHHAWLFLDVIGQRDRFAREAAVKLRDWWRTHAAQPKVAMTEELESLVAIAMQAASEADWFASQNSNASPQRGANIRKAIESVLAQAAGVKP